VIEVDNLGEVCDHVELSEDLAASFSQQTSDILYQYILIYMYVAT
jgi:hypothetical protein